MKDIKYPYVPNSLLTSISGKGVFVSDDSVILYKPNYRIYLNNELLNGVNGIYYLDFSDRSNNYTALINNSIYTFNDNVITKETYSELKRISEMMSNTEDSPIFDGLVHKKYDNATFSIKKDSNFLNIIGSADIDEILMDKALYDSSISYIGIDTLFNKSYSKSNRTVVFINKIISNSLSKGLYLDVTYDKTDGDILYKLTYKHMPILAVSSYPISIDIRKYSVSNVESIIFNVLKIHVESMKKLIDSISQKELHSLCTLEDTIETLMIKKYGDYKNIEEVFKNEIIMYNSPL